MIEADDDRESDALKIDGFDDALVGFGTQFCHDVAIYSYEKCVEILVAQGMTYEDAEDYLEFNVAGAWVGNNTPVLLRESA